MSLSSADVVLQAGVTTRQLDYWTRGGFVPLLPRRKERSGIPRRYDESVVPMVALMGRLVRVGAEPALAAAVATRVVFNGETHVDVGNGVTISVDNS